MATTRKKRPARRDYDDDDERDLAGASESEMDDFYSFLEEVDTDVSAVDVFRLNRDGSRPHIDRCTVDVLREDVYAYLRTHGPGKYLLRFRGPSGLFKKNKTIEVAGPAVQPNGNTPNSGQADHITVLREQLAQQQTILLALIQNNKGPDLSFLSGVLRPPDMTPITTLMAAMINKKDGGTDGLTLAKTIVELSRDMAPEGGKEPETWLGVAKEIGGKVVDVIGAGFSAPGPPPLLPAPTRPAVPPPARPPDPPPTNQPEEQRHNMATPENFRAYLKQGIDYLKTKAIAGKDVAVMVDWILENEEEPHWAAVLGAIAQGATFENLLQFDPEINRDPATAAWFKSLYDDLHDEIFNPVDPPGKGGNPGNAGGDAGSGPTGSTPVGSPPAG